MTGTKVSTFRERFAELLNESEKTTVAMSKELKVSNQTISAWKTGARSPKEPTIIAIANHFGVNVAWLMGFDVEKEQEEESQIVIQNIEQFSALLRYMDREDYEFVIAAFDRANKRMKENGGKL